MSGFRQEVERTDRLYQAALEKLNRFQQGAGLLNPTEQAQQKGTLLTGLLGRKLEMESQLFVLRQSNKTESPRYRQLVLALESVRQQVDDMRAQITGGADASLANVITSFPQSKPTGSSRRNSMKLRGATTIRPSLPQSGKRST